MRTTTTVLLLCLTAGMSWQDPKPAPKKPNEKAPAKQAPAQKEIPGTPKRHAYEGVYKLTGRVINGVPDAKPSKGYMALTGRHLFLNLASSGPEKDHPLVNSGVREWRPVKDGIRTTARLDWYTDSAGDLHFVPDGKQEIRNIVPIHGGLRVVQGLRTYLDFERIE